MQVREVMVSPAVTVDAETTVHEAIATMLDEQVGSVIVVDPGVEGIATRSDILRAVHSNPGEIYDTLVTACMSTDLVMTTELTSVDTALRIMKSNSVKKLPVRQGTKLVGILTLTDIAHHLPEQLAEVRRSVSQKRNR